MSHSAIHNLTDSQPDCQYGFKAFTLSPTKIGPFGTENLCGIKKYNRYKTKYNPVNLIFGVKINF